jgi:hypothetical protein
VGFQTGSKGKAEQAAVWHVLRARQKTMRGAGRDIRLDAVARAYCAGFNGTTVSSRTRWVRDLNRRGKKPKGWPSNASWEKHRPIWKDTLDRASLFLEGKVSNPCPGAKHFGNTAVGDIPKGRMKLHKCSDRFSNQFYLLESEG